MDGIEKIDELYRTMDKQLRAGGLLTIGEAARKLEEDPRVIRAWVEAFPDYVRPYWDQHARLWLQPDCLEPLRGIQRRLRSSNPPLTFQELRAMLIWEGKVAHKAQLQATRQEVPEEPSHAEPPWQPLQETIQATQSIAEELCQRMEQLEDHLVSLGSTMESLEKKVVVHCRDTSVQQKLHQVSEEMRKWKNHLRMELRTLQFQNRFQDMAPESSQQPRRQQRKSRFLGMF